MSGFSYKAVVDDSDMRAKLAELIDKMQSPAGFYKNVGEHLFNRLEDSFDNETAPDGTKWQGLSEVTIDKRLAKGHGVGPMLRISGMYQNSWNWTSSDTDVRIGSPDVRAAIFNLGGDAGRNNKVHIPARPHVGIAAEDEQVIFETAEDWLSVE